MRRSVLVAATTVVATVVAGCSSDASPQPTPSATSASGTPTGAPTKISFLAYGAPAEVKAYRAMVQSYNVANPDVKVSLVEVASADAAVRRLQAGHVPDVFLMSRRDLSAVVEAGLNQHIDELLDSRGVDFTDDYKRDSIRAFSHDEHLECMPYGISPMVMYYNTNLVDFSEMQEEKLPAPTSHATWTWDQFAAAAKFGSRYGAKGVYIDPSLLGIAPFVYSGGGSLFDDDREPSRLDLESGSSLDALTKAMELLRQGAVTPTPRQLRSSSALQMFKDGKLAMIAGFRTLTPELRKTPGLSFDVMPMPALPDDRTVGDASGLCISAKAVNTSAAADFVVHAIGKDAVSQVAAAGYMVPTNTAVSESDAFLQKDRMPAHAYVFNRSVKDIVTLPLIDGWPALEKAVHSDIYQLFYNRVIDIEGLAKKIDEESKAVLSPPAPSTSPTPTASATS
ncbi:ABC transporter substrate-binding protein [Nocardioides jiangxiensis]|uniref:Extracellular solute-binding protein n=1 Tax=Nocardioides jiangxiensis TaxID=3064524 RepID=A0ABT9B1L8_9ACTN|nr:extracellular solute-binding protein [Nocardioides sp. WY-20]MDO7868751.1 extracellular solute-binding protein [Nocardioides sp. WY-20]